MKGAQNSKRVEVTTVVSPSLSFQINHHKTFPRPALVPCCPNTPVEDPLPSRDYPNNNNLTTHMMDTIGNVVPEEIQRNLPLVHRVLLSEDLENLTISGHPPLLETPPYEAFAASLERNIGSANDDDSAPANVNMNINALVKGAFRDQMVENIVNQDDGTPAAELLCELHTFIRKLVPSRPDLHGRLDDQAVRQASHRLTQLVPHVIHAATALQALESPARSETTAAFVRLFTEQTAHLTATRSAHVIRSDDITTSKTHSFQTEPAVVKLLVGGLLYLLFKAELCQDDKDNYYLTALWAPALQTIGPRLERLAFAKQYGPLDSPTTAPATRHWIEGLVRQVHQQPTSTHLTMEALTTRHHARHHRWNLIRQGWVEDVLFRPADAASLSLPEILAADAGRLQGIRHLTRMAAAGSALALLACQAAEAPADVLALVDDDDPKVNGDDDSLLVLNRRRKVLVQVMADHFKSPVNYEKDIANAVLEIARIWKPNLDPRTTEGLMHRTKKVLEAQDPVIQLLDSRMKECFRELVVHSASSSAEATVPSHMQAGSLPKRPAAHPGTHDKQVFLAKANALFKAKGLAFYASDLSQAARLASRVIDLVLKVYGEEMLDRMVVEACQKITDQATGS